MHTWKNVVSEEAKTKSWASAAELRCGTLTCIWIFVYHKTHTLTILKCVCKITIFHNLYLIHETRHTYTPHQDKWPNH